MSASPPSSSRPHHPSLSLPPPKPSSSSRRLPPPCWSHDETMALIDAYRDKWYSLRRGNLRAVHWQEVADALSARCPLPSGNPAKTSVQCRHKMEKLRKRYRAEKQRSLSTTAKGHRYCSSWVHFDRMDSMEKGSVNGKEDNEDDDDEFEDDQEDDEDDLYTNNISTIVKNHNGSAGPNGQTLYGSMGNGIPGRNGFRIKMPNSRPSMPTPPVAKVYGQYDDFSSHKPNPNPNTYAYSKGLRDGGGHMERFGLGKSSGSGAGGSRDRMEKKRVAGNPVAELVSAIKVLGDGFVKMERVKMEMAREIEAMRMDMEMKRTEMMLESQHRIMDAFVNGISETKSKRVKRMPTDP